MTQAGVGGSAIQSECNSGRCSPLDRQAGRANRAAHSTSFGHDGLAGGTRGPSDRDGQRSVRTRLQLVGFCRNGLPVAGNDAPGAEPLATDALDVTVKTSAFLSRLILSGTTDRLSERTAQAFGMSVRPYRRHLAQAGTSHGSLLADTRLKLALDLLSETDLDVTEIALELGYAFPKDFTRFFRSRVGLSPSKYRSLF